MEKQSLIKTVTAAQKGDSKAISALFNEYHNQVYYIALSITKDAELAADITQETFIEIIKTIGNLKDPAAFVSWMKLIAHHQCSRYYKKKETKHEMTLSQDEEDINLFEQMEEENTEFIPDEALDRDELRRTIMDMVNSLPEAQRAAVMMRYFDEMSVKEIAAVQEVSEGTVMSRLNYARKSIKQSVESYEKKHGIRLHNWALLPLLHWLFASSEETVLAAETTAVIAGAVSQATGIAVTAVTSGTAAAGTAAAATTLTAKIAAMPIAAKIVAGVAAVSLMFGAPYAADVIGDMITSEPAGTQMPQEPETSLSSVVLHTWADDEMISIYEQGSWTTHAVYLTLEGADDTIANVQYCINDSACSDFEEKLVIEEEGEHFVKIKIADINDDERELWLTVKIDKTAPTLSQSLKNKYASGSLAASGVSVSSEDFSAQIDDVSSVAELEAFEKQHGACYYGWYMGQTGRDMAVRALQAKEWISNSSAYIAVEADDTLSKIKTVTYTVNGKEYSSNEAAFKISNLPNGIYKVVITAYDEAGNSASQTVSIKKDSTVPKTKVVASVANGGFSSSAVEASIKSSNSAGVGGLWYSFEADNGSSGSFGYHGVGEKYTFDRTQTVTFTSYSQSGLIGSTVSYKITIDTDKPDISIMDRTDTYVAGYVEDQTSPIKEAYFTHNGVKTVIEPYGDGLVGNFNIVLQSGENVIEIFVKDSAGNVNTYSETITI